MNISDKQQELLDELNLFQDWTERYEYVIGLGKKLPSIDDEARVEENLIKGCQSQVWVTADKEGEQINYSADSDSVITKGMIALFIRVLNGNTAEEILTADMSFIEQTKLKEHLAPTRANALTLMEKQMKKLALELSHN